MSTGRRAYDILRAYVHQEWERIKGVERTSAEQELQEAMESPAPAPERATVETHPIDTTLPNVPVDRELHACRLLGVNANASFEDIRKAFERLNKRSDPTNFPEGSNEAKEAGEIQKRAHWAYTVLTEKFDATEKRFRSLEI